VRVHQWLKSVMRPLASRKVRVAIATVVAAFAADWGLDVGEELVLAIVGVGVSLILGIAHEDAGRWSAGDATVTDDAPSGDLA